MDAHAAEESRQSLTTDEKRQKSLRMVRITTQARRSNPPLPPYRTPLVSKSNAAHALSQRDKSCDSAALDMKNTE
jgi:hypothetical protein